MTMNDRDDDIYRAASMYYRQGQTMDGIAHELGVSRSSVSRLLRDARESGLVRISLTRPTRNTTAIETAISDLFEVRCHVVTVREGTSELVRLARVAQVAGGFITDELTDGATLGLAWGNTVAAIVENLGHRELLNTTVVQLNGGANAATFGIPYVGTIMTRAAEAFGAEVVHFPVPAFFDRPETKDALWRERSVLRVLKTQRDCNMAVFGIGTFEKPMQSHVYVGGFLDPKDMAELRAQHVVGDVCTVLLREDGTWANIPINRRASGPTPQQLQHIPRRIAVAAGTYRVAPLLGALRAQVPTDLILDEDLGRALLERAGAKVPRRS